jgi:hypothetical protein
MFGEHIALLYAFLITFLFLLSVWWFPYSVTSVYLNEGLKLI